MGAVTYAYNTSTNLIRGQDVGTLNQSDDLLFTWRILSTPIQIL